MDEHLLRFDKSKTFCFIDCETCNLNLNWQLNRPWQVGILFVRGEAIEHSDEIWIKWGDKFRVGDEAAKITGFTKEALEQRGISPEEAFQRFWSFLVKADYIIGHNLLGFDVYLLKGYAEQMGVDWSFIVPKIIDTKALAMGIKTNNPVPKGCKLDEYQYNTGNYVVKGIKTRLSYLGKEMGIEFDENALHNATEDLKLNLAVWNKLKYLIEL
jgi:DNA polymerase III epsilon subunit-like protein